MPTNGNNQPHNFDCEGTENEGGTRPGRGEEHESGHRQKESGWHHDQSGEFHRLSLFSNVWHREPRIRERLMAIA
jgi:hypothetical protein